MIAILDYKAGNLASVKRALDYLSLKSAITNKPEDVLSADRIIFPGVGAAGATMKALSESGLDSALREVVAKGKPVLGICIGCQIILEKSDEYQTECLGLIKGHVKAFPQPLTDNNGNRLKIPHMGWNEVNIVKPHPLLDGITSRTNFYFVHSYYPEPDDDNDVYGRTDHGVTFASVIGQDNLMALQFHTEKSGPPGLKILQNFSQWRP